MINDVNGSLEDAEKKNVSELRSSDSLSEKVKKFIDRWTVKNTEDENKLSMRLLKSFVFAKFDLSQCEFVYN